MIRVKLMLCIVLSIATLSILMYVFATSIILKSYLSIEHAQNEQNLVRVEQALRDQNLSLQSKLHDWSRWDDTYTFIGDGNEDYKNANLQIDTLSNLDINVMLFVNLAKSTVSVRNIDLEEGRELEGYNLGSKILTHSQILEHTNDESVGGIIQIDNQLLALESAPIVKSNGEGPLAGTIVFGRFIDDQVIAKLAQLTQLNLELFNYDDAQASSDVLYAKEHFTDADAYVFTALDETFMGGYILLRDINDKPVGIIKVTMSREIYNQGKSTLNTFIITSSIAILLFGLLIIALIQRLLFSRLTRLNKEILTINAESSMDTAKVSEGKKDEMGTLARKINDMLTGLFSAQANERRAHQLQMEAAELLQKQQKDAENMSRVMVEREIKMNELNNEIAVLRNQIPKG